MPVSSSTEHWIKPDALTINLNHFGDPDYLQVSVLAGAVVMAFKQDVISYNAAHNYRTWPLDAANTYLETTSAYNVYARLTRSEVNARALVVYDTVLRDIEGREITYAEDGSEVLGDANPDYFFVFLGQISASVNSNGEPVQREWNSWLNAGSLQTNQQQNDLYGGFERMFRPHYDDPLNPDKITWIEALTHLGVTGGITMFVDGGKLNLPSIYAGIPIDNSSIYWEEVENEDGSVTRILKAKVGSGEGGSATLLGDLKNVGTWANEVAAEDRIMVQKKDSTTWTSLLLSEIKGTADFSNVKESGEGNAYTSFTLSEDKKTLTFVKGETFAKSSELSNKADKATTLAGYGITDAYTKTEVDGLLDKKWTKDDTKISNWDTAFGWGDHSKQGYTTKTYVDGKFLPLAGGTVTGNLRLRTGSEYTSPYLYFGDGDEVYLKEATDRYLTIHAYSGIILDTPLTTIDGIDIKKSEDGVLFIDANLVVSGGITMYGTDGTTSPSIWDGAPLATTGSTKGIASFDPSYFAVTNGVVTFIGSTGDSGGTADSVAWSNVTGKPSWIGSTKPSYTFSEIGSKPTTISGYGITDAKITNGVITLGANTITPLTAHQTIYNLTFQAGTFSAKTFDPNGAAQTVNIPTKTSHLTNDSNFITSSYVDGKFVTIAGSEDVTGVHNFTNGLKVGGIKLSKSQDGVIYLEGNLVVSGGITMFGTDSVTASTVMDGVNVDGTTIIKSGNKLMLNPDLELGGGLDETALASYLSSWVGSSSIKNVGTITSGTWNGSKIANAYLANSAVTISGKSVSLGGSITQAELRTALGLGSNAYTSTAYLPKTGGTITGSTEFPLIINTTVGRLPYIAFQNNGVNGGFVGGMASGSMFMQVGATGDDEYSVFRVNVDGSAQISTNDTYYDVITDKNASSKTVGNATKFNGYTMRTSNTWVHNSIDARVQYTIDASALSISNFYPIIFSGTSKDLYVCMYSQSGLASAAYNQNKLEFTFRGYGWNDAPQGLTVHNYNCYTAGEMTIGRIGMGAENGHKVVWVRGGLTYYIISNITPTLKTSNYTSGNEVYTVGTGFSGGTNTKVTIYWTPQSTSGLGTMYHSGGLALGDGLSVTGNASVTGTSTFTGLATFNGNLTAPASTTNNSVSGSYQFRNSYGASLSSAGWYRFATSATANNTGGTYIFHIRRSYNNTNNESYIISATVDYGGCNFTQLAGHYNTQLITQIRCTYDNNGTMYFDLYYSGTVLNEVFVNAIGNCTLQTPTKTTSTLSVTNAHAFTDGFKSGVKTAYALTLYRNATSGGCFIMYGSSNQLARTWAVGSNVSHQFAWFYKDTDAGTDLQKMYLDSSGNLFVTGNVYTDNSYFVKDKTGAGNGYSLYNESLPTQYGIFMGTTSNFNKHGGVTGGWATYFCMNGFNENRGWIFRNSYNDTNVASITTSGDLLVNGGITMYSDIRKKTKLKDVELTLKQVAEAPLIEHYYNSDEKRTTHVGSIAQYWAGLNYWFCKKDSEGFYTMEIQNAALASAISVARELDRYETKTDKTIKKLKKRICEIEEEVERLKAS